MNTILYDVEIEQRDTQLTVYSEKKCITTILYVNYTLILRSLKENNRSVINIPSHLTCEFC